MREGRARRILIRTKKNPTPTQNTGEDHAIILGASTALPPPPPCRHFPVPVIVVVSATSPGHPWPSCSLFPPREQLLATAVGGPVVVVVMVVMAILVLAFPWLSWFSHSWRCWVIACCSVSTPRAVARSGSWPSSSCPSTRDPSCEQWRAAAVGVIVSPLPSRRAPRFHPASSCSQRQLGVLSWCQLVPLSTL
jgi:hypothetical protein